MDPKVYSKALIAVSVILFSGAIYQLSNPNSFLHERAARKDDIGADQTNMESRLPETSTQLGALAGLKRDSTPGRP
ncbi:unnamed protein product [Blepharisma stoltei]|uniref:Uncharacterized protein n=1 Tax=Blepharisma stoltei TaxID=1481888 RepID=A0AAU9JQ44_9CILI|nr:unnamed protein product [Blepharisma stoltei]